MLNFYGALTAFVADVVVTVAVTMVTKPKPVAELAGLVWGVPDPNAPDPNTVPKPPWWASPKLLGGTSLGIVLVLSFIFI
jgi:SSS family solute:Na+ symporter